MRIVALSGQRLHGLLCIMSSLEFDKHSTHSRPFVELFGFLWQVAGSKTARGLSEGDDSSAPTGLVGFGSVGNNLVIIGLGFRGGGGYVRKYYVQDGAIFVALVGQKAKITSSHKSARTHRTSSGS